MRKFKMLSEKDTQKAIKKNKHISVYEKFKQELYGLLLFHWDFCT